MTRQVSRNQRRRLRAINSVLSLRPLPIAKCQWPNDTDPKRKEVWRSRDFLVQVFAEDDGVLRMSVNRSTMEPDGYWTEGITWDELQKLKRQIGRGDMFAVEIYPRDKDIVNVSNIRHLWILPKMLPIGWRA